VALNDHAVRAIDDLADHTMTSGDRTLSGLIVALGESLGNTLRRSSVLGEIFQTAACNALVV
jgi:hypothetical protein